MSSSNKNLLKAGGSTGHGLRRLSGTGQATGKHKNPPGGLLIPDMALLRKNLEPLVSRAAPSGGGFPKRRTSKHLTRSR